MNGPSWQPYLKLVGPVKADLVPCRGASMFEDVSKGRGQKCGVKVIPALDIEPAANLASPMKSSRQ